MRTRLLELLSSGATALASVISRRKRGLPNSRFGTSRGKLRKKSSQYLHVYQLQFHHPRCVLFVYLCCQKQPLHAKCRPSRDLYHRRLTMFGAIMMQEHDTRHQGALFASAWRASTRCHRGHNPLLRRNLEPLRVPERTQLLEGGQAVELLDIFASDKLARMRSDGKLSPSSHRKRVRSRMQASAMSFELGVERLVDAAVQRLQCRVELVDIGELGDVEPRGGDGVVYESAVEIARVVVIFIVVLRLFRMLRCCPSPGKCRWHVWMLLGDI